MYALYTSCKQVHLVAYGINQIIQTESVLDLNSPNSQTVWTCLVGLMGVKSQHIQTALGWVMLLYNNSTSNQFT